MKHRKHGAAAVFLLYLLVAIASLGANPFRGETTGPFDLLASYPGWNDGAPVEQVRHPERSDILDSFLPDWMEARRQIRSGTLPLWNPLPAGGRAAILAPTRSELTIGFALFTAAPDPAFGFYLAILSSLVIAGLGMDRLVRLHCSTALAPVFAGISYMLCGFMAAWLFWPHAFTAIWIPWLLYAIGRHARSRSARSLVGIVVATAAMFLGGFPFVVAIGLGAALVYGFFASLEQSGRGGWKPLLGIVFGIVAGLALVAVPMLTLWAMLGASDLGYRQGGSALTLLSHAKLLLLPWAAEAPRVESHMYVGMIALAFGLIGLARISRRANALVWTGLVCLVVGAALTFGLIPAEIGSRLPVLSNNPWSRAILLLDIGIILLAAVGLEFVLTRVGRRIALGLGLAACLVQGFDLGHQFRNFNGPTPARMFYAVSPGIEFLQDELGPFEYVGADGAWFMISGTLGAVGIGEWYAHALRSQPLRNVLDAMAADPFSTPTATMVGIENYRWSSHIADVASLCYALYPSAKSYPVITEPAGPGAAALPPINRRLVVQPFELERPTRVAAASVRLATYRAMDLDGTLEVAIVNDGGETVASAVIDASRIRDNIMAVFEFGDRPALDAGDYALTLHYEPGKANRNLTAWTRSGPGDSVVVGQEAMGRPLDFAIRGGSGNAWEVVAEFGGVAVAHNPGCAGGIYRVRDLTSPSPEPGADSARLVDYRPHSFTVQTASAEPGYVVVPMQYQRGWKASLDDRHLPIQLVKGVFPAVAVPKGPATVTFSYRPPYWKTGIAISLSALLLLLGAWRFLRKREPKMPASGQGERRSI